MDADDILEASAGDLSVLYGLTMEAVFGGDFAAAIAMGERLAALDPGPQRTLEEVAPGAAERLAEVTGETPCGDVLLALVGVAMQVWPRLTDAERGGIVGRVWALEKGTG